MYYTAKCLKLSDLYKYYLAQFFYKMKNNFIPISFQPYININTDYNLRSNILHNFTKLSSRQKHAFIAGPIIWNSLPTLIKSLSSTKSLKNKYKQLLLGKYC